MKKLLVAGLVCASLVTGLMVRANDIETPFKKEALEAVDFLCKDRDGVSTWECRNLYILIKGVAREYAYNHQNAKTNDEKEYHWRQIHKQMSGLTFDDLRSVVRVNVAILAEHKNIDEDTQSQMITVIENNLKAQGFQLDEYLTLQEQLKEKSKGIWGYFKS
jgi:hypothetical protein